MSWSLARWGIPCYSSSYIQSYHITICIALHLLTSKHNWIMSYHPFVGQLGCSSSSNMQSYLDHIISHHLFARQFGHCSLTDVAQTHPSAPILQLLQTIFSKTHLRKSRKYFDCYNMPSTPVDYLLQNSF